MTVRMVPRWNRFLRYAERSLWVMGALLAGCAAGAWLEGRVYQAYQSRQLDHMLRAGAAPAERGVVDARPRGGVVGRLEIPRVGLSAIVLDGDDAATLLLGVGRAPGITRAGGPGNLVLSGHRDTFFRPLRYVRKDDRIRITTLDGAYPYVVQWTAVVDPKDTSVLADTPEPSLTLITCYPFQFIGAAPQRFIVRARLAAGDEPRSGAGQPMADARPSPFRPPRHALEPAEEPPEAAPQAEPPKSEPEPPAESLAQLPGDPIAAPPVEQPAPGHSSRGIGRLNPGRLFRKLARVVRHSKKAPGEGGEQP